MRDSSEKHDLNNEGVTFGRAPHEGVRGEAVALIDSARVAVDQRVSRLHARIAMDGARGFILEDLNSTNGSTIKRGLDVMEIRKGNSLSIVNGDILAFGSNLSEPYDAFEFRVEGLTVTSNKAIRCRDCQAWFDFTESEQEFFRTKGFAEDLRRCKVCRDKKRNSRNEQGNGVNGGRKRGRGGGDRER